MNVCTEVELDLQAVEEVVRLCGEQIKARGASTSQSALVTRQLDAATGLDQPLLFSSRALDLSGDGTAALIRSFFADRRGWPHGALFLLWAPAMYALTRSQSCNLPIATTCEVDLCRRRL